MKRMFNVELKKIIMKKILLSFSLFLSFFAVKAQSVVEIPAGVIEAGYGTVSTLPYDDAALQSDWSASANQPEGWSAVSVLNLLDVDDPSKLPLPCEYPSKWAYSSELGATAISDNRIAAHVLMLPYVEVPENVNALGFSFEAMIDGKDGASITYCATEGVDNRFNGTVFLQEMMAAVFDPTHNATIATGGKEFHPFDFTIENKGGKGLNIVLVAISMTESPEDVTYAIRNVKVYDKYSSIITENVTDMNVYGRDGQVVMENIPEGAKYRLISMQSGIEYGSGIINSSSEVINVSVKGFYAVVVENGDDVKSFKINIR